MTREEEVIAKLRDWADQDDSIRAVVLVGSRVQPNPYVDMLSDYDIELYVGDIQPFMNDDWLRHFGDVMVRWPLQPMSTFSQDWLTRLVLFQDGMRIDFQITTMDSIESSAYAEGCKVLIDKDGLTNSLHKPTFSEYLIKKPAREEYESLVNGFLWDTTYVAKNLWRDELYYAKYMLDSVLRFQYLQRMIEWHIGAEHDWSVSTGKRGRFFKRYLDSSTWAELEATFAGAGSNWQALFNMMSLFRRLAVDVANSLGFEYPVNVDKKVTDYCQKTRTMEGK